MESINQLNKILLQGKKVIVRGDLDSPVSNGKVDDPTRIDATRETLDYLVLRGARVILAGHLGRPEGKVVESLRLNPIAEYLKSQNYQIIKLDSILGTEVFENVNILKGGEILMLENLRFDPREEKNDPAFSSDLASYGEIYVNECFSTSHRAHASFVGVPKFLRSFAGLRLQREVETITQIIETPKKPVVAILGGVKIETKLPVISKFLSLADFVLLGGKLGMYYEGDNNSKILVPIDYIGEQEDIGPKTIAMFTNVIKIAKTVIWNGPMGKFEDPKFLEGTRGIAQAVVDSGAYSLVGGGDTTDSLGKVGLKDRMSFISVGGGALLDFIAGKKLPALESLDYYA